MTCASNKDSDQPGSVIAVRFKDWTQGFFMHTAKTNQTWWMPRLIRVFTGCTGHFVQFVVLLILRFKKNMSVVEWYFIHEFLLFSWQCGFEYFSCPAAYTGIRCQYKNLQAPPPSPQPQKSSKSSYAFYVSVREQCMNKPFGMHDGMMGKQNLEKISS